MKNYSNVLILLRERGNLPARTRATVKAVLKNDNTPLPRKTFNNLSNNNKVRALVNFNLNNNKNLSNNNKKKEAIYFFNKYSINGVPSFLFHNLPGKHKINNTLSMSRIKGSH